MDKYFVKVVVDIEGNGLQPTHIWVIVCLDIETGEKYIFRSPTEDVHERQRFNEFSKKVDEWIGHNILNYDGRVLNRLIGNDCCYRYPGVVDTLIISKLLDYSRGGHSLEHYGEEFGVEKDKFSDFTKYSIELENRCIKDVEINHKVYLKYLNDILKDTNKLAIDIEHMFQLHIVNELENKGFSFNIDKGNTILNEIVLLLDELDKDIEETFVPKLKLIRVITPKETKYGTISLTSIPKEMRKDISDLTAGASYSYCRWVEFNPNSHKQIIDILTQAGWKPIDKTKTHIDTEREYNRLKQIGLDKEVELIYSAKLADFQRTGWKVNENNLETLPPSAPSSARLLARRILLEARRRVLKEWLELVGADSRIHGKFYGIGAWTHRMAHQQPNTANIPNEYHESGRRKLYGKEFRSLWCAPKDRLLVGVDAEGIQLRIFAHLINDPEFTEALVRGRKDDKTDPHSLNQRVLGSVCRTRQAAKRFIYALLLGGGLSKLAEILECNHAQAQAALDRILQRYTGFARLKEKTIRTDAARGWFHGLDGRVIKIPGDDVGQRRHLAMSGYLQSGEAIVMKQASLLAVPKFPADCFLVNLVHDEWQVETPDDMETALQVASLLADSLRVTGEMFKLNCPLSGSYKNDNVYTIGKNWSVTH